MVGKTDMEELLDLMERAKEAVLREEKSFRTGGLLKIKDFPVVVIGDLHGDYLALESILKMIDNKGEWSKIVFLGDYADRGPSPLEVYKRVFEMKCSFPDDVFLLRGNHEAADLIEFYPHDLPWHIQNAYGERWREAYESLKEIHKLMPLGVLVEGYALMLHGGVSADITLKSFEEPTEEDLEVILWSDPSDLIKGSAPSHRGAGMLFGSDVTFKVLEGFGVRYLIRGHSPVRDGYRWDHAGRVLTIFSAKHVYGLDKGAYAILRREHPFIEVKNF